MAKAAEKSLVELAAEIVAAARCNVAGIPKDVSLPVTFAPLGETFAELARRDALHSPADVSRHCPECERLAARVERLEAALIEIRGLIAGGMDNFEKWKEANEVIDTALTESGKESE